ncbi:MAG: hypothetical protein DHS20C09_07920 [marine bacterium B5-7]|nr:MAG: hypothetical protein DHS20C09_07920 [marine bacterium B5-7]
MPNDIKQLDRTAGKTIIHFTDLDPASLKVDAVVEEQDTNLLLGNTPVIMEAIESFPVLVAQMEEQIREIPGSVIVKKSKPKRLIAIIYDVEHTPICEESWVKEALQKIFSQCYKDKINNLAMPLLGTTYGKLTDEAIVDLLQDLLMKNQQHSPKKIFIYEKQED